MKTLKYHLKNRFSNFSGKIMMCYWCNAILVIITFSVCTNDVTGQVSPVNIGFESGTFAGWTGATGQCCPVFAPNAGIDTSRHVITSGNFSDPHSNNLIPVVAPNNNYSARLGNENNSAESEILEYTFTVPTDSLLVKISFAVLLENGLHPSSKQTRFSYRVTSATSLLSGCTEVDIIAGGGDQDTVLNGDLELYFWQSRFVNLTGHAGENISIRFETGDCGPGGHFGYAYVDCELINAPQINPNCNVDGNIIVTAQSSLGGIWHDGTITDTLVIENPTLNGDYFLELNTGSVCSFKIPLIVNHMLPFVNFSAANECEQNVSFNNFSQSNTGAIWIWDFGDGTTTTDFTPFHQYQMPGNYLASLTIHQTNNCTNSDSVAITIEPENNFSIIASGFCPGEIITLKPDESQNSGMFNSFSWYIDNLFHDNNFETSVIFGENGFHHIMLISEDLNGCFDTTVSTLEIRDDNSCLEVHIPTYIPNAFTPNGDGKNDIFEISSIEFLNGIELLISDRFGKVINYGEYWDGTSEGNLCPEGIYIYRLTFNHQNRSHIINGTIALIR